MNEQYKLQKQTCKFVPAWYKSYPYVEYSITHNKIYFFVCRLFGFGVGCEQSELAWIQGINKWNKMKSRGKDREGKLALHFGSKSHAAAPERYLNYKVKENHVDLMLDSRRQRAEQQREAVFKHNCTVISILIDISRFLVRQSLAFRGRSGYEDGIPEEKVIYGFS